MVVVAGVVAARMHRIACVRACVRAGGRSAFPVCVVDGSDFTAPAQTPPPSLLDDDVCVALVRTVRRLGLIAGGLVSRFVPLFLAPVAAVAAGVAFGDFFNGNFAAFHDPNVGQLQSNHGGGDSSSSNNNNNNNRSGKGSHSSSSSSSSSSSAEFRRELALVLVTAGGCFLAFFVLHCTWVAGSISTPSVFLTATEPDGSVTVYDDYREAYAWLAANTSTDARVLSWWDYG